MSYIIHINVVLGQNCYVGQFVIIGEPPLNKKSGELKTFIGDNAIIRSHCIIYAGNSIGDCFQTGHGVMIREENKIGNNVSIGTNSVVEHHVIIGNNVRIHSQAFIPEYSVLEDGVWIGPNVVLTNAKYPLSRGVKTNLKGPVIKKNVIIGANATILPGIIIEENVLVGAGAVVTKDVSSGSVVVGNPAKKVNVMSNLPYCR